MKKEDSMIMGVEATSQADDNKIRLKYIAISGGCGPELVMDEDLARQTVRLLTKALEAGQRRRSQSVKI